MSSKLPTVSIIIPVSEGIAYLSKTIDSILQQTYVDFEALIFIDDCRLRSWFGRQPDSRLRFIVRSKLNLATALNQGIMEAKGKYIAFTKPGDLWHPHKLQTQISALDNSCSEVGLVYSEALSIDSQSNTGKPIEQSDWNKKSFVVKNLVRHGEILASNRLNLSTVMLRRQCFDLVGWFDPSLSVIPDWEMWIRLSRYCKFMTLAEPLVYSQQHLATDCYSYIKLEIDLQAIIEKVYTYLPSERESQKHLSYGYTSLFLAQQILQQKHSDPAIARNYLYQALQHDWRLALTPEFCHLRWWNFIHSCRQSDRYCYLLERTQIAYEGLQLTANGARKSCLNLLDWMLEGESVYWVRNRRVNRQGKD